MLKSIQEPQGNDSKKSSGIGLAYRITLLNQTKRKYHQKIALGMAGFGTLSAFFGILALYNGWFILGALGLFGAGCATQGVNIITRILSATPKIALPESGLISPTDNATPHTQKTSGINDIMPLQNNVKSQANYPGRAAKSQLRM